MSVARVTELISASTKSFEDAIKVGVSRAVKTLKNVEGVWVDNQKCVIKNGKSIWKRCSENVKNNLKRKRRTCERRMSVKVTVAVGPPKPMWKTMPGSERDSKRRDSISYAPHRVSPLCALVLIRAWRKPEAPSTDRGLLMCNLKITDISTRSVTITSRVIVMLL